MPLTINAKLNLKACINVAYTVLCSPLTSVTTVGCQAYGFNFYALSPYPGMMLGHKNAPYLGGTGMLTRKNKMLITQIMSTINFFNFSIHK
jgi:hypothetical protein